MLTRSQVNLDAATHPDARAATRQRRSVVGEVRRLPTQMISRALLLGMFALQGCAGTGNLYTSDCHQPIASGKLSRPLLAKRSGHGWVHRSVDFGFSPTYWQRFPVEHRVEVLPWEEVPAQLAEELPQDPEPNDGQTLEPDSEGVLPPSPPSDTDETATDEAFGPSEEFEGSQPNGDGLIEQASHRPSQPAAATVSDDWEGGADVGHFVTRAMPVTTQQRGLVARAQEPALPSAATVAASPRNSGANSPRNSEANAHMEAGGVVRRVTSELDASPPKNSLLPTEAQVGDHDVNRLPKTRVPDATRTYPSRFQQPSASRQGSSRGLLGLFSR